MTRFPIVYGCIVLSAGLLAALLPLPVLAYIAPILGMGVLGPVLGVTVGIALSIVMVLWWPVRQYLRKRKAQAEEEGISPQDSSNLKDDEQSTS